MTEDELTKMERELYEEAKRRYPDHMRHGTQQDQYLDFTEGVDTAIDYLRAL